jgi:glucose/mannose-6-phosphate isomerase
MRDLIEQFPAQIKASVDALKKTDSSNHLKSASGFSPSGVLILGMGGSGIGGAIAASILAQNSTIPVLTNADYTIPNWVGEMTLVVACSYSGNTEETLSAVKEANGKGAKITSITSGGELLELASGEGWPTVTVPGGLPPRSQFPQSFLGLAWTLKQFGILPEQMFSDLTKTSESLLEGYDATVERATALAELVSGKNIFLYSDTPIASVATRWRQQLNENSKLLVNSQVFPELNHNELVGWAAGGDQDVVIIFRTPEDHKRTQHRMDLSAEIFQEMGADVVFVEAEGENVMERVMDLVFLGDYLSLLLAESSGVDPVEIDNIINLKTALDKL